MRVNCYLTEMNNDKIPTLVKEKGFNYSSESLTHPDEIAKFMDVAFHLGKRTEEYIYMISFDTKMKINGVFQISHGVVNASLCSPREVYIRALLTGAANIALIHNHPSGVPTPSKDDLLLCKRIKKAGEIIGVSLCDFIIIGDGTFISFLEKGLL